MSDPSINIVIISLAWHLHITFIKEKHIHFFPCIHESEGILLRILLILTHCMNLGFDIDPLLEDRPELVTIASLCMGGPKILAPFAKIPLDPGSLFNFSLLPAKFSMLPKFYCFLLSCSLTF